MKYRRRVYIALFLITTHISSLSIMVWLFHNDREYIANTYCIYKNVKSNTCRGLCYLSEKLDLLTDQDGKKEINFSFIRDNYLIVSTIQLQPLACLQHAFPATDLFDHYKLLFSIKIFQPPRLILCT